MFDTLPKFVEFQQMLARVNVSSDQKFQITRRFASEIGRILSYGASDNIWKTQETALWDFVCLFILRGNVSDGLLPDVSGWLRDHIGAVLENGEKTIYPRSFFHMLECTRFPERDDQYWHVINRLVSIGWMPEALELLGLHSSWSEWDASRDIRDTDDSSAVHSVLEAVSMLLRRFPMMAGRGPCPSTSVREFETLKDYLAYRLTWKNQCRSLLNNDTLWKQCSSASKGTSEHLRQTLEILIGRQSAFVGTTWIEVLVANLMHSHPGLNHYAELRQILHECCSLIEPDTDFLVILAAVMDSCCDLDVQSLIRACSEWASPWMMAHLSQVLGVHSSATFFLDHKIPHLGALQVEWFILELASALATSSSTWGPALEYLAWCRVHGAHATRALLDILPLGSKSNSWSFRAAQFCSLQGLTDLECSLLSRQGALCWQAGLHMAALGWMSRSKDWRRCDVVIKQIASDFESDGSLAMPLKVVVGALLGDLPYRSVVGRYLKFLFHLYGFEDKADRLGILVDLLSTLPFSYRLRALSCLHDVLSDLDNALSESDAIRLLQWLDERELKEISSRGISIARLSIIRLLVGYRSVDSKHMIC